MELKVLPLTLDRWADLERVFLSRGCSQARGCWCMYYRESGRVETPAGYTPARYRKKRLMDLALSGEPPGLLGYSGGEPVGWVSLGPRGAFPKLARSPVMRPVDDVPVWSVVCFVVPGPFRGKGVASGLLRGAVEYSEKMGAPALEAYPVDRQGVGRDESMWFGSLSMYLAHGFVEVARRKPERPVVRRYLGGGAS